MKWQFFPQPMNLVETEVTQRDQFKNDEVDFADTIVRESVQNSMDAQLDGQQVTVAFRFLNGTDHIDPNYMKSLLDVQVDHANAARFLRDINFENPAALVIEDFGTKGLTGATDCKDNDNFCDFWRRHGKSHKTGLSRGRWGLGKLVFSSSSTNTSICSLPISQPASGLW